MSQVQHAVFAGLLLVVLLPVPASAGAGAAGAETHPGEHDFAREVAQRHGVSEQDIISVLDEARFKQSIIDVMTRPAEAKPWKDYRRIFLTPERIDGGIEFYRDHRELIERISAEYGVAPEYIVAILGVETSYGRITGHYRVLDALTTLAFYYPPRETYFRGELERLLTLPKGLLPAPLDQLTGSYAGAMGWGQFMPSSLAAYARDGDGDRSIDMNDSVADIVASVANYFSEHGWQAGAPVAVPAQRDDNARPIDPEGSKPVYPVEQLEAWGYAPLEHANPARAATLLELQAERGPRYWLTFRNFYVITRYNHSPRYAMAVHQLAQAIAAGMTSEPEGSAR